VQTRSAVWPCEIWRPGAIWACLDGGVNEANLSEKPIQRARARSARSNSDQRCPTSFPRWDADRATIIRGWVLLLF
jgi:hypothetical protein